jgi:RND superfamily putative drug exporter
MGYSRGSSFGTLLPLARPAAPVAIGFRPLVDASSLMFESLAKLVIHRGWVIVLAWLAFSLALQWRAPSWEEVSRDDDVRFFPARYPSVVGQDLLERGFPSGASSSEAVLVAERRQGPLTEGDKRYVDRVVSILTELRESNPALGIKTVDYFLTPVIGPRLIGTRRDSSGQVVGQAVLTIIHLNGTYLAKSTRIAVDRLEEVLAQLPKPPDSRASIPWLNAALQQSLKQLPQPPAGLKLALTGSAVVGHDMNDASNESIANTTYATITLVVVILLVVYRSPLLASIPLLTIALSAWAALKVIALLTKLPGLEFQVINITNVFVIVVLFGAGTDYCLFLIARYREELVRGLERDDALRKAIMQVGGALVASAGTVIVGLGMLWFSNFAKTRYTGPSIALSLAIALAAALTLAPVLLHYFRGIVFWPYSQPHHVRGADPERETLEQMPLSGFWLKVADLVVRYPVSILALCVLALLPLAIIGARTKPNYSQLADLNADRPSVIGAQIIKRYFSMGELSPSSVLIENPRLDFSSGAGRVAIDAVSRRLAAIPDVAEVRSVSQPLGKPQSAAARSNSFFAGVIDWGMGVAVNSRYVSLYPADRSARNHITRIDVVFRSDPFSERSLRALEQVFATVRQEIAEGRPLAGTTRFGLTGASASVNDLSRVTTGDERRMYVLGTLGVYAILVLLLRRPGVCLYLIATVVLGYLAALGITELTFQALHRGPEPWVGLDWKVGFFLFVILMAVGEDYNIFLMSRVIEEERKHGVVEGTRLAVAHTGGIISSCGLIMAGTFGSMLTGSLTALRELGFALGLGVLVDTFVVRPILVPAFLVLMDRYLPSRQPPAALLAETEVETEAATTTAP